VRTEKPYKCGQECNNRLYCSPGCQKMDWTCKSDGGGCHKLFCKVAGEIGVDYNIRDSGNEVVGLGIFALRDFAKNDIITGS